jgi:hypothetical protein
MGRSRFLGGTNIEKNARDLRVYMAEESGVPYQVMVSDDDTTPGYLSAKITSADASVVITVLNDGADEDLDLSVAVYVAAEIATHTSDADAHHNQSHVLATASGLGADHTVSGLTAGHVLRATGGHNGRFWGAASHRFGGPCAGHHQRPGQPAQRKRPDCRSSLTRNRVYNGRICQPASH